MRAVILIVGLTLAEAVGMQTGWKMSPESVKALGFFLIAFVVMDLWEVLK